MSHWLRYRLVTDRLVAVVVLIVLSPVIVALAVAVRVGDRGRAFVAVPRIGKGGAEFGMWKLRSMRIEQGDGRAKGVSLTAAEDDRITPVGHWLRARYLDELPQLWNVVKGEMCLLSARPEAPEFVDLADPRWQAVLVAPPGMAGPTQLIVNDWEKQVITKDPSGASYTEVVVPVKLAIDGWYLRKASPRLDLMLIRSLLGRLAGGRRPERLVQVVREQVPESVAADSWPTSTQ